MKPTQTHVYMRQSTYDKNDYRYVLRGLNHTNVFQIGRVLASTEYEAERKVWHKTTPIGRQCCITCILADIMKDRPQ